MKVNATVIAASFQSHFCHRCTVGWDVMAQGWGREYREPLGFQTNLFYLDFSPDLLMHTCKCLLFIYSLNKHLLNPKAHKTKLFSPEAVV